MATVEIGNIYCTIKDASTKSLRAVDNALSALTPGCEFAYTYKTGKWDGRTRFYTKRGHKFPTGLITDAVRAMRMIGEQVEIVDTREPFVAEIAEEIKLKDIERGHITLRDYQHEAVYKSIMATRGVVNVATNGGKTEIACGIIQQILPTLKKDQKIAFFTHSREIFTQSHARLEERLGIKVGKVGNGEWDERQVTVIMIPTISLYMGKKIEPIKSKKYKEMVKESERLLLLSAQTPSTDPKRKQYEDKAKSLTKQIKEYVDKSVGKKKETHKKTEKLLNSLHCFIADEVHHASSDTWYKVFMSLENAYYRFGLTGTIDDTDEVNLKRLYGSTGRIVKKVSNKFLIDNGYSAKPTIYMLSVKAYPILDVSYREAKRLGIIENKKRNQAFVDKILEESNSGNQCLVIVNETKHGEILYDMLEGKTNVEISHGGKTGKHRDEVMENLRNGKIRVLIVTTIFDEGVDVPGLNCLFLAGGGQSMRQILQRIGRGLRKKKDGSGVKVYDALDYHNEYLVDHTAERYNYYKEEGFEVRKV
jgi:superfamily II DNA or RNA helicase